MNRLAFLIRWPFAALLIATTVPVVVFMYLVVTDVNVFSHWWYTMVRPALFRWPQESSYD